MACSAAGRRRHSEGSGPHHESKWKRPSPYSSNGRDGYQGLRHGGWQRRQPASRQPVTTVGNSAHSLSLHLALHGMPSVHERPPEDRIPRNGLVPKRAYVDVLRAIETHHLTCTGEFYEDPLKVIYLSFNNELATSRECSAPGHEQNASFLFS